MACEGSSRRMPPMKPTLYFLEELTRTAGKDKAEEWFRTARMASSSTPQSCSSSSGSDAHEGPGAPCPAAGSSDASTFQLRRWRLCDTSMLSSPDGGGDEGGGGALRRSTTFSTALPRFSSGPSSSARHCSAPRWGGTPPSEPPPPSPREWVTGAPLLAEPHTRTEQGRGQQSGGGGCPRGGGGQGVCLGHGVRHSRRCRRNAVLGRQ